MIIRKYLFTTIVWFLLGVPFFAAAQEAADFLNAPNKFVTAAGVTYAYRILGKNSEYPLIMLQHFRGNMDNWDPALINALAAGRTVIVFDNKGVGLSSGETPDNFEAMGDDAASFIGSLGYKKVDVLGFSIGGAVAQELVLKHPELVRKLILAGTAPKGGVKFNNRDPKVIAAVTNPTPGIETFLFTFFAPSDHSQQLGKASLMRRLARKEIVDKNPGSQTLNAHIKARQAWGIPQDSSFAYLQNIRQPVLVANGSADIMFFTENSYLLYQHLPDAKLVLYPDSGHGFLFQYPIRFAKDVCYFLDEVPTTY